MRAARIALAMPPSRVRTVALPALDALAIAPVLTDDTTRSALRSRPAGGYVWEARGIEQAIASHAASNVDNRSGRRSASADCNKSNIDAAVN